ncbi:MAG: hypothetical protein ABIO24_08135 [Saprospiraceae bacterium]
MLAFFLAAGIATANAQCHASAGAGKSCCASKAASAAAADPTIEKRQSDDGAMSYVRKEADQQGNVRFVSVQFDESQNAFVNVAPPTVAEAEKAGMVKKEAAACATGEKKACCAKSGKSCSGGKSAAAEQ